MRCILYRNFIQEFFKYRLLIIQIYFKKSDKVYYYMYNNEIQFKSIYIILVDVCKNVGYGKI